MRGGRTGAPVGKSKLSAKVFPQDSTVSPDAIEQVLHDIFSAEAPEQRGVAAAFLE